MKNPDTHTGGPSGAATAARRWRYWTRTIAYWGLTGLVAYEMVAGAFWDLLQIEFTRVMMARMSLPTYLPLVWGIWKLPCAMALVSPRFQRLKEWAYAGAFFHYSGAVAVHFLSGYRGSWPVAFTFAIFTMASWALRPPGRRLPSADGVATNTRPSAWLTAGGVIVGMIVLALLTLPKGPPPP